MRSSQEIATSEMGFDDQFALRQILGLACPRWVKDGNVGRSARCLLCPHERTLLKTAAMPVSCQYQARYAPEPSHVISRPGPDSAQAVRFDRLDCQSIGRRALNGRLRRSRAVQL